MSEVTTQTVAGTPSSAHQPFLAHHFASREQQFDAGKLGMWIFLVTEVLFFSGLFVAYAVYRSNHPEVFVYAHQFLNKTLGALNTIVLLFSSLTMAWSIRCAQLNQRRGLIWCLAITLVCGAFFLGVKACEYSTKWNEGLLWAGDFAPTMDHAAPLFSPALLTLCSPAVIMLVIGAAACLLVRRRAKSRSLMLALAVVATAAAFLIGTGTAIAITTVQGHDSLAVEAAHGAQGHGADGNGADGNGAAGEPPRLAGVFFSIYYAMTGVHAIHILAGMGLIGWLLHRAARGDFNSNYFSPIDFVGLYWHLVDLVWIYLFPLLYLIH